MEMTSKMKTACTFCLAAVLMVTQASSADNHQTTIAAWEECIVNADGDTYDSHPSTVVLEDGTTWIAWHAYRQDNDQVLARRIDADGNQGPIHIVSGQGKVHGPPTVVPAASGALWVAWTAKIGDRWQVRTRNLTGDEWSAIVTLSDAEADAIYPAATMVGDGKIIVAWSGHCQDRFRTWCRVFDRGNWQDPLAVSSPDCDAYRPALVADAGGGVWVFWDQYNGDKYAVCGRKVLPEVGSIERLTPKNRHCLTPTVIATGQGLYVAWLRKADVIGGPGAISQMHTLETAVRRDDGWEMIADSDGNETAAELTHGLMAKIAPTPLATGGYTGRRTVPMLLEDGDDVWLLWERKADHRGSTPNVVGELLARPMRGQHWGEPVVLHQGRVDYHLAEPPCTTDGKFAFLASALPRQNRRIYHRLIGDLNETMPFEQDESIGWRPVDLPIESELTERREIQLAGRTYKLYWADPHCHSGLTADAEGEPDELTHYARDRAMLDVVVFTENDFIYDIPLTGYEYELGNFFAKVYSQDGRFVSLPAYEWTSRVPGDPAVKISDPSTWTVPYKNRSFANHRSVIYPPTGGPAVRYPEVGNDIARLNQAVEAAGGITLTQHPVFRVTGHKVEVGLEVVAGWGSYIARRPQSFHEPLDQGFRLAFIASGDSHRRAPGLSGGLTAIYAEDLTAEAILDGLRNRRCYATNGSRIFLDSRANGAFMGAEAKAAQGKVTLTLRVIGTRPIVSAHLIRDGVEVKMFEGNGNREFSVEHEDSDLSKGTHWYYWRVAQQRAASDLPGNVMVAHGHLAWSSPHWVVVE